MSTDETGMTGCCETGSGPGFGGTSSSPETGGRCSNCYGTGHANAAEMAADAIALFDAFTKHPAATDGAGDDTEDGQ